ncbi:MAG: 1,4-alpha-glucan branching enzyme, partial [Bacilli bacterium]
LINYVKGMHYTHIELMPILEHPLDASWGYQVTGYFSATHRYGNPKQLMHLIDLAHQNKIGIILDFVPVHFCKDAHGLYQFDGQEVFGYQDHRLENQQWGSANFNLSDGFVQSFLLSSILFWIRNFNIDGIRVDAVSYLIYEEGNENKPRQDGLAFIKKLNTLIKAEKSHVLLIAEDSSAYQGVTKPIHLGGLGFDLKWNLGWMNDSLKYMSMDPFFRQDNQALINFSFHYMYHENYILPLSHDEVVHGKKSIIDKMFGTYEEQFKQTRLYYTYMYTHPGKKLTFMGNEIASFREFDEDKEVDWFLLDYPKHQSFKHFSASLNKFYLDNTPLYTGDYTPKGFKWLYQDYPLNILAYMRMDINSTKALYIVSNFSNSTLNNWHLGVPKGQYLLVFCSNWQEFGGNISNETQILETSKGQTHQYFDYLSINLEGFTTKIYQKI